MKKCLTGLVTVWLIVGVVQILWAAPPPGFTCLGSTLSADWGSLSSIPEVIKKYNLTELIPSDRQAAEKMGITITPEDESRGYVVFSRNYVDDIYPYSLPNNRITSLSTFACPEQYEALTFALYPLKDTEGLRVSVSDLKDAKGSVIRSENVDVRVVRCIPFVHDEKTYAVEPTLLEKRTDSSLQKEKVTQYWLTLYVPKNARPGDYTGKISLISAETPAYSLDLSLRVLPIKLQSPDTLYGMCFLIPGRVNLHPENLDKYYADMRAHNMNSQWIWPDAGVSMEGGKVRYDFTKFSWCREKDNTFGNSLVAMMDAYKKAGFTKTWVCGSFDPLTDLITARLGYQSSTPEFDAAYLEFMKEIQEKAKSEKWPPYVVHPKDEPAGGGEAGVMRAKALCDMLKKNFPDVRTFEDVGPWIKEDRTLSPSVDVLCYACQAPEDLEFSRKAGNEAWIYNQGGWGRFPKIDRDRAGLYTLKIGAKGSFEWVYTWWYDAIVPPSWHPAFMYVVPSPDGPLPTRSWEAMREGIDDVRYMYTLTELIKKAKASGKTTVVQAAEEASGDVDKIMSAVPVRWSERDSIWTTPSAQYDANRLEIAEDILETTEHDAVTLPPKYRCRHINCGFGLTPHCK